VEKESARFNAAGADTLPIMERKKFAAAPEFSFLENEIVATSLASQLCKQVAENEKMFGR